MAIRRVTGPEIYGRQKTKYPRPPQGRMRKANRRGLTNSQEGAISPKFRPSRA